MVHTKSTGSDGACPQVLRSLGGNSITFERSGEVPEDWKKANVIPTYKKGKEEELGNCRLVSLISIPGKVMEQLILETISRYMKKQVAQRSCGISTNGDIQNPTGHCLGQPIPADLV